MENLKQVKREQDADSKVMLVSGVKNSPHQKYLRKTSEVQKDLLIQYFEDHGGAIDIVSANNTDAEVKKHIWSEIAEILNRVEGGVEKNDMKWSKTWADMKLYAKNRAKIARQEMMMQVRKPTDQDRRILKVSGHEDLLRNWEAAVAEFENNSYEKVRIEGSDHEIVLTEGTDYEYIEEEELVNVENNELQSEPIRIERYYSGRPNQYDYSETSHLPIKMEVQSNKRKQTIEQHPQVVEIHEDEERVMSQVKRMKHTSENEEQRHEDTEQESDPMVGAINNLANALHSVASALTSFAEVAKSFSKR